LFVYTVHVFASVLNCLKEVFIAIATEQLLELTWLILSSWGHMRR